MLLMKVAIKPNKIELKFHATKVYPELEDLEVTPSSSEQSFKSSKYGYDIVKVKAIETTELNIMPSTENQVKEGTFSKVTVAGDSNLVPENIKKDITIFGVNGLAEVRGQENAEIITQPENGNYLSNLTKILPTLDFSKTTSMQAFFSGRTNLEKVSLINTNKVTNMQQTFYNCKKLVNISFPDTSNVTNMKQTFYGCINLETIENLDTSKVTTLYQTFVSCQKLTSLQLNTANVTDLTNAFYECTNLKTISLLDCSKVNNIQYAFYYCNSLENLGGLKNIGKTYTVKISNNSSYTVDLSHCPLLTHESLMNLINNLYDLNLTYNVANGGTLYTQKLNLGSTNLAKLTAEEIAIATSKRLECNLKQNSLKP